MSYQRSILVKEYRFTLQELREILGLPGDENISRVNVDYGTGSVTFVTKDPSSWFDES